MGQLVFQATLGGAVNLIGPNIASTVNFTLPSADGSSGQTWTTNGSGVLSFGTLGVAGGGTGVTTSTGTGSVVLSNSPTLVTPALGTPSSATLTNATGLPISTGVSGLGTGVATALAVNVGSAGAPVVNGGALGTPSSGTVTNLTGTASININGTVGATTPTTGAFTTVAASSSVTLSGGTANGVTYLNGSKVLTSGSALTFDGTDFSVSGGNARINKNSNSSILTLGGSPSANWEGEIHFVTSNTETNWRIASNRSTAGSFTITPSTTAGGSTFSTPAINLSSSGNLGLGIAPSAWYSTNSSVAQVRQASFYAVDNSALEIANNTYLTSGGSNWNYINTAAATRYNQSSGAHKWYYAASGTGGTGPISWTQAMTLDASGSLLNGSTSWLGTPSYASGGFQFGGATYAKMVMQTGGTSRAELSFDSANLYFTNSTGNFYLYSTSGLLYLGSETSNPIVFNTGGTERARITSGGYFKASNNGTYVNSTASYHEFRQTTSGNVSVYNTNTTADPYGLRMSYTGASPNGTDNWFLYCEDSGPTLRASIRSNGGLANYSANDVNLSDRREKTNFALAGEYLSKICAIPVQTFNYIDQNLEEDDGLTLGVVAQDVQAVAPELVMESNWGTEENPKMRLSIYQTDLQYALMKCIQEQQAIIESLKARLDAANL